MNIVYASGERIVNLAAGDKLAVSSYDVVSISQLIKNANQPDGWSILYITQTGATYTTDAFASAVTLKIDAFAADVLYDIGPNAVTPTLESLSDDIDTINEEISEITGDQIVTKYRSAVVQAVSDADTDTLIKFGTYESGDNTIYDASSGVLQPTTSGLYLIGMSVTLQNVGDGEYMNAKIYKNGASFSVSGSRVGASSSPSSVACSDVVPINGTTDTVSFYIRSDSATAATDGDAKENFFYAIRVGSI